MKFNLNITDMNEEEFARIFHAIHTPTGNNVTAEVSENDIEPSDETINFDKEGLPWDARIHSSNHKLTAKGVWQRRKGITDDEFNAVKNELLGVEPPLPFEAPQATPTPVVAPVAPEVPNPFVSPSVVPPVVAPTPVEPHVIPMTVPPVVAPTPAPAIDGAVLYQTMFKKLQDGMANQVIKPNDFQTLVAAVNTQFGTQYQSLAQVKDNIPALQFVINDLTTRGL